MKHSVELKLPKIFGKKKQVEEIVEETKEKLELEHSVEINIPRIWGNKKVKKTEETDEESNTIEKSAKNIIIAGGVVVATFGLGYLVGHHKGASRTPQNVFIMK